MNKRLLYIDALRGMTMILVVYYHIINHCFPETILDKGLQSFRMPIFFFVSGFIAFKELEFWTARNTFLRLVKKFHIQIIPTAIFFSLYCCLFYYCNPFSFYIDYGFRHYWFTTVLFEFFVVYYIAMFLTRRNDKINVLIVSSLIIVSFLLLHATNKTGKWCIYTQFSAFLTYAPFFLLGTLTRRFFKHTRKLFETWWILIPNIIVFFILLLIFYLCFIDVIILPKKVITIIDAWLLRLTGMIMVFGLFVKFRGRFTADGLITQTLTYIGQRTLDIYLMHFFFTAYTKQIFDFITSYNSSLGRPFTIVATGITVSGCLLLSAFIRKWKPAGKLLFGAKY